MLVYHDSWHSTVLVKFSKSLSTIYLNFLSSRKSKQLLHPFEHWWWLITFSQLSTSFFLSLSLSVSVCLSLSLPHSFCFCLSVRLSLSLSLSFLSLYIYIWSGGKMISLVWKLNKKRLHRPYWNLNFFIRKNNIYLFFFCYCNHCLS